MIRYFAGLLVLISLLCGCAQTEYKTELAANTDTMSTISSAQKRIDAAYEQQWDVLAKKELMKSSDSLEKARKYDAAGKDQDKVVKELSDFETHYAQAERLSEQRRERMTGLLAARKTALSSGVREYSKDERRKFYKLDQEFRDMADDKNIDAEDYAELQQDYLKLAGTMKKNMALDKARGQVKYAIDNKAKKHAPEALNTAQVDIKSAENMIDSNLDKPEAYRPAVERASLSAALLAAIVSEQKKVDYKLDERAARRLIEQNGTVAQLNNELMASTTMLRDSQGELQATEQELQASKEQLQAQQQALVLTQEEIEARDRKLQDAEAEKRFQVALAEAQRKFSPSEADVYRQGDRILIRLKSMEFNSGKADVPTRSKAVLDRVASMAQDLNAKEVVVEGHTDSVGSAGVNEKLSQARAESVVNYLASAGIAKESMQSTGYGFQKPISSNKSKEGRAQNRRVDVWITPQ